MKETFAMRARTRRILAGTAAFVLATSLLVQGAVGGGFSPAPGDELGVEAAPSLAGCTLDAGVRTCHIWARAGVATLTTGVDVPLWGYASTALGDPELPGPTIVALTGEILHVVLHNDLTEATSLSFPGQDGVAPDAVGAAPGDTATYEFEVPLPGTFIYQAGLTPNGARQVAMGLYGAFVVRPSGSPLTAYDNDPSAFDREQVVVVSEVDPALGADPTGYPMSGYHPTYWLFNGKAYPSTDRFSVHEGERLLLRYVNAGLQNHSIGLLSLHQQVVGRDGSAAAYPTDVSAETIPAGSTLDTIIVGPGGDQDWDILWSAAGHLDNAGATSGGTVELGGQLAFLDLLPPDTLGPEVLDLVATPNPGVYSTTIGAIASELQTGGLPITAAEWSLDTAAAPGAGVAMTTDDGSFDYVAEGIRATLDLSGVADGVHTIYVRARDSVGNWTNPPAAVQVNVDQMFAAGFESGTTEGFTSVVQTRGNVKVTNAAAIIGAWGLQVRLAGKTPGYVVDATPLAETRYEARFYFDPNGTVGGRHTIFVGRSGTSGAIFRVEARRLSTGARQIRIGMLVKGGTFKNSAWHGISDAAHSIEIAWRSARSSSMRLWIDGRQRGTIFGNTRPFRLDAIRLGPSGVLPAGLSGIEYFDDLVSSETTYIGP